MNVTKTAGLGLATVLAAGVASCPIVQAAVLGIVGGLGLLTLAPEYRQVLVLAVFACAGLAVYSAASVWRRRRERVTADPLPLRRT